ncbi:MAG: hypothetical protein ACRD0K_14105, partial [Egibacteraceae bacterium]
MGFVRPVVSIDQSPSGEMMRRLKSAGVGERVVEERNVMVLAEAEKPGFAGSGVAKTVSGSGGMGARVLVGASKVAVEMNATTGLSGVLVRSADPAVTGRMADGGPKGRRVTGVPRGVRRPRRVTSVVAGTGWSGAGVPRGVRRPRRVT